MSKREAGFLIDIEAKVRLDIGCELFTDHGISGANRAVKNRVFGGKCGVGVNQNTRDNIWGKYYFHYQTGDQCTLKENV